MLSRPASTHMHLHLTILSVEAHNWPTFPESALMTSPPNMVLNLGGLVTFQVHIVCMCCLQQIHPYWHLHDPFCPILLVFVCDRYAVATRIELASQSHYCRMQQYGKCMQGMLQRADCMQIEQYQQ